MAMSSDELGVLVRRHLPDRFLRRALQGLFEASKSSWDDAYKMYDTPEAQNLQPFMKRGLFEGYLRGAADLTPGMAGQAVRPPDGGPWFHTEVTAGPVVLTAASTSTPCGLIDPADYKITLAETNEPRLFEVEPERVADVPLYVALVHARYQADSAQDFRTHGYLPGAAHIVVPAPRIKHYLWYMDLFAAFPDIVDSRLPQDWTQKARLRYVQKSRRIAA